MAPADLIDHELAPGADPADNAARIGGNDVRTITGHRDRVRGVAGVRRVDASIFPDTPSMPISPTNITLADGIAADRRASSECRRNAAVALGTGSRSNGGYALA